MDEEDQEEEDGEDEDQEEEIYEDEAGELSPLLPIFSAAHLGMLNLPSQDCVCTLLNLYADALPVYNLTHTIRLLVVPRCETTLSWDQLRSPQVSQFLIKPIQQQIRSSHFSKATLYALMANCLQFNKEVSMYPGNSGASKTRALVCELLAIKLLKEFSTRELVCLCSTRIINRQANYTRLVASFVQSCLPSVLTTDQMPCRTTSTLFKASPQAMEILILDPIGTLRPGEKPSHEQLAFLHSR